MNSYTSYFAKVPTLVKNDIIPIGIALWQPKFFSGHTIGLIAPKRYMLNDSLSEDEYTEMYIKDVLEKLDLNLFISLVNKISKGKDVAFCCYEKPSDFCHRHIFAKWFTEKTGEIIEEFGQIVTPAPIINNKNSQLFLFD